MVMKKKCKNLKLKSWYPQQKKWNLPKENLSKGDDIPINTKRKHLNNSYQNQLKMVKQLLLANP